MEAPTSAAEQEAEASAAGAKWRPVKTGETLAQIAAEAGQPPETIWNHPLNTQLRQRLKGDPNMLASGDGLYIPPAQEAAEEGTGPVGQGDYIVKQGDCMASIAAETGHFWETIWNDPANADLKEARQDPYVLLPGDRVTIPPLQTKKEAGATEKRHRFVRKGCPERLSIQFKVDDKPRANEAYVVEIDAMHLEGYTGADGRVDFNIPPNAKQGRIVFTASGDEYELALGDLDPITEVSGVQGRLRNLGFYDGPVDGKMNNALQEALRAFQAARNPTRPPTGVLDDDTREAIQSAYGS